jgi:hypothetical protein
MNEPDAADAVLLNRFYYRLVDALRSVDPDHILFLDGNGYGQEFSELDPPYDSNSVYSYHFYPEEVLSRRAYPFKANGLIYDRNWLESMIAGRSEYMRHHNLPAWAGEFGCFYRGDESDSYTLPLMNDLLDLYEDYGHHWTIWTYKDIGKMGTVYARPESEWMHLTQPVRGLKSSLRCDFWVERHENEISRRLDDLIGQVRKVVDGIPGDWDSLPDALYGAVCEHVLSQMLLPAFAAQFAGLEVDDIECIMQSFALSNGREKNFACGDHRYRQALQLPLWSVVESDAPRGGAGFSLGAQYRIGAPAG